MIGNATLYGSIITVLGGLVTSLAVTRYGPALSKQARRRGTEELATNLRRAIDKREKTIQYIEARLQKAEQRNQQLAEANRKLRETNEIELKLLQALEMRFEAADAKRPNV